MNTRAKQIRKQIHEWIEAAESIRDRFGLEKALGYVIGEKFYHMIANPDMFIEKIDRDTYLTILSDFAQMIMSSFTKKEIVEYFDSNPRYGPLGHVAIEDEHRIFVQAGSVEHSIDTEARDAIVQGKMEKLLGVV